MNVYVKQDDCIGCGLCVSTCPSVFTFNEDGVAQAKTYVKGDDYAQVMKQ